MTGEYFDWLYHLHPGHGDITDIEDLPIGYKTDNFGSMSAFIEVLVDQDESYYERGAYLAL